MRVTFHRVWGGVRGSATAATRQSGEAGKKARAPAMQATSSKLRKLHLFPYESAG